MRDRMKPQEPSCHDCPNHLLFSGSDPIKNALWGQVLHLREKSPPLSEKRPEGARARVVPQTIEAAQTPHLRIS